MNDALGGTPLDIPPFQWPGFKQLDGGPFQPDSCFRKVLDVLPAAIYITDADGRITYYNDAAATLWGHRPELGKSQWCGSWKLYWPDGRPMPHDECPMALALRQARPIRGIEAVAERPDGVRVPFIPYPTPLRDASGTLVGAINMLVDITDRKVSDENAQKLASIVEFSDDAIVSKNLDGIITSWNRGAERLFGYTAAEVIGKPITIVIPPDRQDEEPRILARIRRDEHVEHYETVRRRKDGSLIDISLTVSPVKNAKGQMVGAAKIARDITERKRVQAQQLLLVREIKHRIKNTLATVQAIASQTLRAVPEADREAFFARLHALAAAHDLLSDENWNQALLRDVVDRALDPFKEKHRERFFIDGPDGIRLDAHKSCLLAMALHELGTNAVKYGSLSNATGKVHVAWEPLGDGGSSGFRLRWQESGGPPVEPPKRKGFGSRLIHRALEGERSKANLEFDPRGVGCTLEIWL